MTHITIQRSKMEAVLEALEHWDNWSDHTPPKTIEAITAVKAALAQECPNLKNCKGACFQCEYFNVDTGMTFQEQIEALPEAERTKFFRGLMAVAEAGRQAGVPPEELAKMYANTYNEVEKNNG
jgi:hypothetical protein